MNIFFALIARILGYIVHVKMLQLLTVKRKYWTVSVQTKKGPSYIEIIYVIYFHKLFANLMFEIIPMKCSTYIVKKARALKKTEEKIIWKKIRNEYMRWSKESGKEMNLFQNHKLPNAKHSHALFLYMYSCSFAFKLLIFKMHTKT